VCFASAYNQDGTEARYERSFSMAYIPKIRFSSQRRKVVLVAGASVLLQRLPHWVKSAMAEARSSVSPTVSSIADPQYSPAQQARFLTLSLLLTGKPQLNAVTAARLLKLLSVQSADFEKQMTALADVAQRQGSNDVEALAAAVRGDSALLGVLHRIVAAWYLGMVGDAESGKVVAYVQALMFDPVRDVVVVPSYCRAGPGYWTAQPPSLQA
jgi:hypothetical protein